MKFDFPTGATPLDDLSGLKLTWVHTLSDLNRAEAENISRAQTLYLEKKIDTPAKWFNPPYLRKIHYAMFGIVWDWAGIYRTSITNIGIKPQLIALKMSELCAQVIFWQAHPCHLSLLEQSARIHHQLVSIHPFANGNGRFSRLTADRYLLAYDGMYPIWPSQLDQEGTMRERYIQSLKYADRGDYQHLIDMMLQYGAKEPILR